MTAASALILGLWINSAACWLASNVPGWLALGMSITAAAVSGYLVM